MRSLAADENFNRKVLNGVLRVAPYLNIIQIQNSEVSGEDDSIVLAWTSQHNLILLSHDYATIPFQANKRICSGLRMTGVLMVPQIVSTRQMIEEIILSVVGFSDEEWNNRIQYLPL